MRATETQSRPWTFQWMEKASEGTAAAWFPNLR